MIRRLTVLATLAALGSAEAHVGDLFGGMDVVLSGPATSRGIDASFGLLWADDGVEYDFICHEAILAPSGMTAPAYTANTDGVLLGVVPSTTVARELGEPVYRSTDGCTWDAVQGLTEQRVVGLAFDPVDPDRAIAVTAELEEGAVNRLFASADGGRTWEASQPTIADAFFRGLAISEAGSHWAASVQIDQDHATVHHSPDGATWLAHDLELPPLGDGRVVLLDLLAVSPTDPDLAWFVRGPIGGPDELLRTTDGGRTIEAVYEARGDISDGAASADGALWVVLANGDVVYAPDGETVGPAPTGTPECAGIEVRGDELVLATRDALVNGTLAVSTDGGQTWSETPVLDLIAGAIECPEETHGAQCAGLWEDTLERLATPRDTGSAETDDTDTQDPAGCGGCSGAGPGPWLPLGLVLALLVRRRRA